MNAIIDETTHLVLSIIVGAIAFLISGNWWAVPASILAGSLIDLDHFIDYFIYTKFRRFNIKEFLSCEYFNDFKKLYIVFHAFEYAIILIILGIIFSEYRIIFFALGFSNLIHLIYDTFHNNLAYGTYFLSYRIFNNFTHKLR